MKKLAILAIAILWTLPVICQEMQEYMLWENRTRSFITVLPQDYDPEVSMPLVINMHPFLMNGAFQMWYTKFNNVADTAGVIVVYPSGINGRWNSGSFFGIPQPVDDVGFLDALIDYMAVVYNIDTRRVYATGYSAGGYMSHTLACQLTNRIAAIAPVSASMNPDLLINCNPDRPVPVMLLNGTADQIVSYGGSPVSASVDDIVELWSNINGCDEIPSEEELPDISLTDNTTTTKFSYNNCDDDSELILYKIIQGSHTWPGQDFPLLGNTSQDIIANEEIWKFFKRHQIPDDIACERPGGLEVNYDGNTASLSWDPVPGIDFYSLLHILPGGELQLVENIPDPFYELSTSMEGEFVWIVRAQCSSGHISWSTINRDDIAGRPSGGRMTMTTYPNPTSDRLFIEFNEGHIPGYVSIVNAFGDVIRSFVVTNKKLSIDMSDLHDGIFHIVVNDQSYASETVRKW